MEQPELKPIPIWDASSTGGGLSYYATVYYGPPKVSSAFKKTVTLGSVALLSHPSPCLSLKS